MPAWKAYEWERTTWPEFRGVAISEAECAKYLRKLERHFKLPKITLRFRHADGGCAGANLYTACQWRPEYYPYRDRWNAGYIKLHRGGSNMGTLVHEFAHILSGFKYKRECFHDRRFKRQLKRVYTWAKRWLPAT